MAGAIVIFAKQAGAVVDTPFRVQGLVNPAIVAEGLTGVNTMPISISVDDGATFNPVFQDGVAVVLTATENMFSIRAAGLYAVAKPGGDTAGAFLTSDAQV